jgi:hypothetical protein
VRIKFGKSGAVLIKAYSKLTADRLFLKTIYPIVKLAACVGKDAG